VKRIILICLSFTMLFIISSYATRGFRYKENKEIASDKVDTVVAENKEVKEIVQEKKEEVKAEVEEKTVAEIVQEDDKKTYYISEKDIGIPILLYHEFYKTEPPQDLYGLISTPEQFEKDMLYLLKKGYTIVSINDLIDYKNGLKALPKKSVVVTFDDGYMSNYTLIYPILKKYNIPATIFVVEDLVGTGNYFDWDSAKEMQESGLVTIASHGHSHVDMTKMDIQEFKEKTTNTLKVLEEKLGKQEHIIYAYPYGFYNEETNAVLKELGVEMCMTTNKGANKKKDLKKGIIKRNASYYNYIGFEFS